MHVRKMCGLVDLLIGGVLGSTADLGIPNLNRAPSRLCGRVNMANKLFEKARGLPTMLRSAPTTPTSTRVDRHGARSGRHTPRALAAALNPSCGSGTATPLKPERSQRDDVQVVVRVRPATDGGGCVVVHSDERSLSIRLPSAPGPMGKSRSYTFDQAFDPATTQAEVFEVVGAPQRTVSNFVRGFTHLPVRLPR